MVEPSSLFGPRSNCKPLISGLRARLTYPNTQLVVCQLLSCGTLVFGGSLSWGTLVFGSNPRPSASCFPGSASESVLLDFGSSCGVLMQPSVPEWLVDGNNRFCSSQARIVKLASRLPQDYKRL